jgi:hypothetical protein
MTVGPGLDRRKPVAEEISPMDGTIPKPKPKATFRRLDKYLYLARTLDLDPATVIAVCVMNNSGRRIGTIARDLTVSRETVGKILVAAEPFLRKRRAAR